MKQIDTRGLSCPQPVILVNNELSNRSGEFEILLDSQASLENIARLLKRFKADYNVIEHADHTIYHVK